MIGKRHVYVWLLVLAIAGYSSIQADNPTPQTEAAGPAESARAVDKSLAASVEEPSPTHTEGLPGRTNLRSVPPPTKIDETRPPDKRPKIEPVPPPVVTETEIPSPSEPEVITALQTARLLYERGETGSEDFRKTLREIAPKLPELKVSTTAQRVEWNLVVINQSGVQFDAVRFRSPFDEHADMNWVFVTPDRTGRWYILPVKETMAGFRTPRYQRNFDAEGIKLPSTNVAVFQSSPAGWIDPGGEYILWFARSLDSLAEFRMAIRLSPAGELPKALTADEVAEAVGVRRSHNPHWMPFQWYRGKSRALSQNGGLLAFCKEAEQIVLYQQEPWTRLKDFPHRTASIDSLHLSAGAQQLLLVSRPAKTVSLWDPGHRPEVGPAKQLASFEGKYDRIHAAAISPDGKTIAAFDGRGREPKERSGDLVLWDAGSGRELARTPVAHTVLDALQFTPDGQTVIGAGGTVTGATERGLTTEGRVVFWDVATHQTQTRQAGQWIDCIAMQAEGRRFATGGSRDDLRIWDTNSRRVVMRIPALKPVTALLWSHQDSCLTYGSATRRICVVDTISQTLVSQRRFSDHPVGVAYLDDDTLVRAAWEGPVTRFDIPNLKSELATARKTRHGATAVNSLGMSLLVVPSGAFLMGADSDDGFASDNERPQHKRAIARPFLLGGHEVTVAEFRQFVSATGYQTEAERDGDRRTWQDPGFQQDVSHPVVCVSWNDATAFCRWLSEKEDRRYRLPTEAEWEYACRAGTTTTYGVADRNTLWVLENLLDRSFTRPRPRFMTTFLWDDGFERTAPVRSFLPNRFGLYDMRGNVAEWCDDWYDAQFYSQAKPDDVRGPNFGLERVVRGGSYCSELTECRPALRNYRRPSERRHTVGFRVARDLTDQEAAKLQTTE